jgi:sigma-B regulation protein RsbU (phosphoserine phosphatase)
MVKEDELKGLLTLSSRSLGQVYTEDDIEMLSTLANQGLVALENARLYEELAEKERIAQELKIARDIQMKLLPQTTPKIEGFDVYSISEPAKEVGGDFFDYLSINDNCIGLCVGDVSGKGVPAALYMAVTDSILQAQSIAEENPAKVLNSTNQILCRKVAKYRSVVMAYIVLEPAKKIARISNCGLVSPILYSKDENSKEATCSYIKVSGMPMGISKKGSYDQKEITIKKGDIILICSDGIVEAKNNADEMFGASRLEKSLMESAELSANQIVNKIIKDVNKFVGDAPQYDDITLMVLKCNQ